MLSCCFIVSFTFIYFVLLALCKSFYFCHCRLVHIIFRYFCIFLLLHFRLTAGYKMFCSIDGLLHKISHINLEACVLSSLLYMHHWFCNFSNSFILPISASAVGYTNTSTATPLENQISFFFLNLEFEILADFSQLHTEHHWNTNNIGKAP